MILSKSQQHRIIDNAAIRRRDRNVLALAHGTARKVARREHVRERERIRAGDLDLSLDRDIPKCDVIDEVPVLFLQVRKTDREEGMIVNRVCLGAPALGSLKVRGPAQTRAALHETHIEGHAVALA